MWPFIPKWKNKNPKTRLQGLEKLNPVVQKHKQILEKIAREDEVYKIRQLAFKLLGRESSQESFMDRALYDKKDAFRSGAVANLNDRQVLLRILRDDKSLGVKESALHKLRYVDEFEEAELNIIKVSIKKIKDQALLACVAKDAFDEKLCRIALDLLSDQRFLFEIVTDCRYKNISLHAFDKLTDQGILAEIAIKSFDPEFYDFEGNRNNLQKVIEKISDQKLLADVAIQSPNGFFLSEVVEKITDQDQLFRVIKETKDSVVFREALERLTNQDMIMEILRNYNNYYDVHLGFHAVNIPWQITDQNRLVEIVKSNMDIEMRSQAVRGIKDQEFLESIARSDEHRSVRIGALCALTDQALLAEYAKKDKDPIVRAVAIRQLTDSDTIAEIVNVEKDAGVLKDANKRLAYLRKQKQ